MEKPENKGNAFQNSLTQPKIQRHSVFSNTRMMAWRTAQEKGNARARMPVSVQAGPAAGRKTVTRKPTPWLPWLS